MRRALVLVVCAGCGAAVRAPAPGPAAGIPRATFPVPGAASCSRGFSPAERHFALDIPAAEGTPVVAARAGVVVRAAPHPRYGEMVIVAHTNLVYTLYAHLASVAVGAGDGVAQGDRLGGVGRTGNATGPHLHFEVLEGDGPLPLRASGPVGIPGDRHRVDPAAMVGTRCLVNATSASAAPTSSDRRRGAWSPAR
jgi:murein DD-endopeptidase MepM/ murein hydrolase activator NlpD